MTWVCIRRLSSAKIESYIREFREKISKDSQNHCKLVADPIVDEFYILYKVEEKVHTKHI
jgi:hypothetical protein